MYTNMMFSVLILLVAIPAVLTANICQLVDNCDCFESLSEVHCPDKFNPLGVIVVHTTDAKEKIITIDCNTGAKSWKIYNFPNLTIPHPSKVVLNACPLGLDGLKTIGIESMKALYVINTVTKGLTLKNEYFQSPFTIETLWLQRNDIQTLEPTVFRGFFQLDQLNLRENSIRNLRNAFLYTPNLQMLDLAGNLLSRLDSEVFIHNTKLADLNLSNNKLQVLPQGIFSSLTNLKLLDLSNNDLEAIPTDIFKENFQIQSLDLSFNLFFTLPTHLLANLNQLTVFKLRNSPVTSIPIGLFDNCTSLSYLDLNSNKLRQLQDGLLKNLTGLKSLDVSNNGIIAIGSALQHLTSLVELNLSNNGISVVKEDAFVNNTKLVYLEMSWNVLLDETLQGRFEKNVELEEVSLGNNYLETLPFDETHTKLKLVDVTANEFKILDFQVSAPGAILDFSDNAGILECSCRSFEMFTNNITVLSDFHCTNLKWIEDTIGFAREVFSCNLDRPEICPKNCTCSKKPFEKAIVVDCSHANFNTIPVLPNLVDEEYNKLEVRLEGNFLETGPMPGMGYEPVTKLYLDHNLIEQLEWTPPNINVLSLHNNNMERINEAILEKLIVEEKFNSISLHNNPWSCKCNNLRLSEFVRKTTKLENLNITCGNSNVLLVNVDRLILCQTFTLEAILGVFTVLLVIALLIKLWRAKKQQDFTKNFDVFVSYSHADEEYVSDVLIPFLDDQCKLKTCVHTRDWTVGEFIPKQIIHSIYESHYTLVVLSKAYFESAWGKMEIKTAHINNAKIIIITKECPKVEDWPKDLAKYLKSKPIISSEDALFWEKLKNSFTNKIEDVV